MKNQYFGNGRDLFKYDLLLDILAGVPALGRRLTYVPMLTPNDASGEGAHRPEGTGRRRAHLAAFLTAGIRNITTLRAFFAVEGVEYLPYREAEYFDPAQREEYFASIPAAALDALIFLDPDVGLETGSQGYMRRGGSEKYLLYQEVASIFRRATASSAVVIYQHLQRNKRKLVGDLIARAEGLGRALAVPGVGYITDEDVVFYGVGRSAGVHAALLRAFEAHGARHHLAAGGLPSV